MFLQDRLNVSTKRVYTDEGFLKVPATISRIGIQEYLAIEMGLEDKDPMDIIKVYRPPEEVFKDESLTSFQNKPVTNNHPPEMVDCKNFKDYTVGHSGSIVTRKGDFVDTELTIMDEQSIKDIESGKAELSNGYLADIDWTPGITPNGESYDAIQRNIKGNHIAIVERGRAGASCRVADNLPNRGDEHIMPKITIDGVDFEVSEQAAQAVGKLQSSLSDAMNEAEKTKADLKAKEDEMEEKVKEAKKTEDSLKAQLDSAKEKEMTAEQFDKAVEERKVLVDSILTICPEIQWQGKDDKTLIAEVVSKKSPNLQMDSLSEDYIKARFDIMREEINSNPQHNMDSHFKQKVKDDNHEVKDNRPADVIAREKFQEDARQAWKKKEGDK